MKGAVFEPVLMVNQQIIKIERSEETFELNSCAPDTKKHKSLDTLKLVRGKITR